MNLHSNSMLDSQEYEKVIPGSKLKEIVSGYQKKKIECSDYTTSKYVSTSSLPTILNL